MSKEAKSQAAKAKFFAAKFARLTSFTPDVITLLNSIHRHTCTKLPLIKLVEFLYF